MAVLDLAKAFGSGGLKVETAGSGGGSWGPASYSMPAGPGQGYFGAKDVYRPSTSGSVKGASTSNTGLRNLANPAPGPGGDGGAPMEPTPTQGGFDVDSIINPIFDMLNQSESEAQSLFGQQRGDVEAQQATSQKRLQNTKATQEGILEGSATRQKAEGESAADEARRQYSEISQGIQGLYGGTTGTGAFATELAGRDTLGRIANIRQGVSQALAEIDNKKVQIQELIRIEAEDIDNEARSAITQAREQLNATLAGIRSQRGELASRKAELAQQAMQNFQGLSAEINARNTAFKQQLFIRQQDAQAKLASAEQRAKGIAESFKVYNMYQGQQATPVRVGNQGTIQDFSGKRITNPGPLYGVGGTLPGQEDDQTDLDSPPPGLE